MSKGLRQLPIGWIDNGDGSFSPPIKRKQFDAGSQAGQASSHSADVPVVAEAVRVSFSVSKSTDEDKLNKTEKAYLAYLRTLNLPWIGIQNITLKLADDTRLTPDFSYVTCPSGEFVFVDVKGYQREDALIKMKVAARQFVWAKFVIVKRDGKSWSSVEVKP